MSSFEQRCVNTIRTLSIDGVQQANSGHPGMPMGMADAAFVLWTEFLRHNPSNPNWINRDRFVLSAGHGSMLLYSLLHLTGYDLPLDELRDFRQWGSKTPGHPEFGLTPGVETTTGPLGQGFATAVGMAIAATKLSGHINTDDNKLIDHTIYGICSDGDLMEGVSHEAASLAGHLRLGNLVFLYDDNQITIDGSTELSFTEDVPARFKAYGWHTITVDGHNREEIRSALSVAHTVTDKPVLISCKTRIGYGSPAKEGTSGVHGAPLGTDEVSRTKAVYGLPDQPFYIDEDVLAYFRKAVEAGRHLEESWNASLAALPANKKEFLSQLTNAGQTIDVTSYLPVFEPDEKGMATRKASRLVLDAIAPHIPGVMGGSADLSASNLTDFSGHEVFSAQNRTGNYLNYGIREHAMGALMNGMALHGSIRPYGGTFLVFLDYCKPALRLAALMKQPVVYVFTHDSIGLGEDGPTHQPVEHIASLRSIPNVLVIRPADASETAAAWAEAFKRTDGPTVLVLTRQNLPEPRRNAENKASMLSKGAYVFAEPKQGRPESIIISTGSEFHIALKAWEELNARGKAVRLVSMPSWELFAMQDKAYQDSVLPPTITKRVSVEAGSTMGWHRYTGDNGVTLGLDRFGESAPYQRLYAEFGFTPEAIIRALGY
ncbi:MAG: transketolase Tkt [Bacteroidetes bacterium HLUCCA01]|nr:MAG: transketolase Tkt [Bacteroidetes bacterium HLUCCA01]